MARMFSVASLVLFATTGCMAPGKHEEGRYAGLVATHCEPPASGKFILASENGLPDSWFVVFVEGTQLEPAASELSSRYGVQVTNVYDAVLGGVLVGCDIDTARQISTESIVCFVEQDAIIGPFQ